MKRSKIFGQILKAIAYLVFALAIFILVRCILRDPTAPQANFAIFWYMGFYGAPLITALVGWLIFRWGNNKVKMAA